MKKYLIGSIALAIICASSLNVNADSKIKDIDGHWAKKEISDFIKNSYAKGYEDNTFRPNNQITRAEFVKLVNKYFEFNQVGVSRFKDIKQNDWYYNEVCIAIRAGYINGYEDNTFRPNNIITREEAAKIIVSIKNQRDHVFDKLNTFSDSHLVSNWAKPYIEGALENGYLKGDVLKKLNPKNNITRAESVTILSRTNRILGNNTRAEKEKPVVSVENKNGIEENQNIPINNKEQNGDLAPRIPGDNRYPEYPKDDRNLDGDLAPGMPEDNRYPVDPIYPEDDYYPGNDEYPNPPEPPYVNNPNYNGNPVIFIPQVEFHLPRGAYWNNYDPNEMIQAVAYDKKGEQLHIEYGGYVATEISGKYIVTAMATDSEGRHSQNEVVVFVEGSTYINYVEPIIQYPSRNIYLNLGDEFNYSMIGVKARDIEGNDISDSIEYSGNVDTKRPGNYPVVISITDKNVNTTYRVVNVGVY